MVDRTLLAPLETCGAIARDRHGRIKATPLAVWSALADPALCGYEFRTVGRNLQIRAVGVQAWRTMLQGDLTLLAWELGTALGFAKVRDRMVLHAVRAVGNAAVAIARAKEVRHG